MRHHFHILENFSARISWLCVCYNSDNFLLMYKHIAGIGGATPKNYTIACDAAYMSETDYS
jgi:hypothetical protein